MVRSSAKNHANVAVVTSPGNGGPLIEALADGGLTLEDRQRLAAEAEFRHTASGNYVTVASWMGAVPVTTVGGWLPHRSGDAGPVGLCSATARTRTRRRPSTSTAARGGLAGRSSGTARRCPTITIWTRTPPGGRRITTRAVRRHHEAR